MVFPKNSQLKRWFKRDRRSAFERSCSARFKEDPMARHDLNGPEVMTGPASSASQAGRVAVADTPGLATPLDRLAPLAAVAAWLATDHRPDVAAALVAVIRTDTRIELDPEEVSAVLADARGEGLDAETAFERLILQGEWLAMDRLARIRPR
jgi:hypothetical protein